LWPSTETIEAFVFMQIGLLLFRIKDFISTISYININVQVDYKFRWEVLFNYLWDVVVQDTYVLARMFAATRMVGRMNEWIDEFESEFYVMTDSQSASLSWNIAPIWGLRPDIY
jgi:hypothetical protein